MTKTIKIEIVEEIEPFSELPWFRVIVDGVTVKLSRDLAYAQTVYDEIINDPNVLKTKEIVLKSEDIVISL